MMPYGRTADGGSDVLALSIIVAGASVWISAIGQHVGNLLGVGAKWVMSDRSQSVGSDGFIGRSARNNVESGAMYVPVAVIALFLHQSSPIRKAVLHPVDELEAWDGKNMVSCHAVRPGRVNRWLRSHYRGDRGSTFVWVGDRAFHLKDPVVGLAAQ
jgi:hypothetical protein